MRKLEGFQKGINLGGWLSQNPTFTKEHLDTFIVKDDIKEIASWGADHIRLPLDFENVEHEDGTEKPEGYAYIDNCLSWCREYGLNVVLDLHKTFGYIFDDPEYSSQFFYSKELQERFIALWVRLVSRYKKDEDILMVELLNEVVPFNVVDEWNDIALRAIKAIREISPTIKILYGGVGYNAVTSIKLLSAPYDENIVYNFHCYEPIIFTHQSAHWTEGMPPDFHINYPGDIKEYIRISKTIAGAMNGALADESLKLECLGPAFFEELFRDGIKAAEKFNVPLYCGEYGVIEKAPVHDALQWIRDINSVFKKYGIGRAIWSYKRMGFGLIGQHYAEVKEDLIKCICD